MLELTLLGKNKLDIADEALKGNLPKDFAKANFLKNVKRNYYSCILVDFSFRGIPQRVSQQAHYAFGGRAEVTFKAYALNDDELKKFEEELAKSDVNDVFNLIEGTSTSSLGQLQEEINSFLDEPEEKKSGTGDQSNPFLALIGGYEEKGASSKKPDKSGKPKETIVTPDTWIESNHFRPLIAETAKSRAFDIFDVYKKSHGMPSYT